MTLTDERELIRQVQAGDREALAQLWDALSPKLFGYLVNTLHNTQAAEDVFQTTWLKVLENIQKYTPRGVSISAWVFTIARNECRQYWRKQSTTEADMSQVAEPGVDARPGLHAQLLAESIMSQLTERDTELLRLRYIADLSFTDIASALNINVVAARVRVSRALSRARAVAGRNE